MRVAFFGTPEFAVPSLLAAAERHQVEFVVSQPDRPSGRGMAVRPSAVAAAAAAAGLRVLTPSSAADPALMEALNQAHLDALLVAAYGRLLPPTVLGSAVHGGLNVHASLLPRWRGASPIVAAILAGDAETGVSIMRMEAGLDTGPVLLQRSLAIEPADTTGTLTERLAELGARALCDGLASLERGDAVFRPQPGEGVTHAGLVQKSDGDLSWDLPAVDLERAVRAYDPWPGVRLPLGGDLTRVRGARAMPAWAAATGEPPGTVLELDREGLLVMAGDAPLLVTTVQPPGRRPMAATDFARGNRRVLEVGNLG